jgi:DNA mismatch repair protein MutS2
VKAEHKRHIKGFIHSESATGRTVYIEPEETLNLNNEIVSLRFAEKREIDRLMRELTAAIGDESDSLLQSHHAYVRLDAVFARGKYAIEAIGEALTLVEDGPIELRDARHPLLLARLGREKTVPLSVEMNENRVLVISGPNAGGKTAAMKCVGLISAMTAAGLPTPADPDSRARFFKQIHIVVGDEQSIENDLSAFSSHLERIKLILERADDETLALLDEIGASTDPAAGAAIAETVLVELRDKGAFVVSTTHHRALKTLAAETEGFENASMEFDPERLAPTYRFAQGLPGSSYAFEIASRIGLSEEFVERARSRVSEDQDRVESMLEDVERKSVALRDRLRDAERENARLKGLADLYEKKAKKLDAEKREILRGAKREAQELVERANKSIERVVKEIRESGASKASIKQARNEMATTMRVAEEKAPEEPIVTDAEFEPRVGAYAAIAGSGVVGEIVEVDESKKTATIAAGDLKLRAPFKNLTGAKRREAKKSEKARAAGSTSLALDAPSYRLDLRGKRVDETTFDVERFLDDARASGLDRVEILHGKGTGALRRAVHDLLKERRDVSDFRSAPVEHGGDGVTIVEMT